MFGLIHYNIFIVTAIILNLTPGADTMYILGRSMSQGKKAGIVSALGISTGAVVHTLLTALGLSAILANSIIAFMIVKFVGAGYLIWLGAKALVSKTSNFEMVEGKKEDLKRIFFQGLLTNVFNPKVALFFLAFLPQFIDTHSQYGVLPFFILGITFIITGTLWCMVIATCSSHLTKKLRNNPKISVILNKLSGVLFIGLGLNILRIKSSH